MIYNRFNWLYEPILFCRSKGELQMKRKQLEKAVIVLGLGVLLTGCGTVAKESQEVKHSEKIEKKKDPIKAKDDSSTKTTVEASEEVIETENGTFSVKLPDGWEEIEPTDLNDEADIGLENEEKSLYLAVLSESEEDYDGFDGYKEAIEFSLDVVEETEKPIDLNGWKGTRRFITAKVDGMKAYYVYDVVASDAGHYAQRMAWTMNSKKDKYGKELESVLDSIKDVTK